MKQKTHSGMKKRVKVKKSGTVMVQKSCKNHLLSNKSKRQKKSHLGGMKVHSTRLNALRRLIPGAAKVKKIRVVKVEEVSKKRVARPTKHKDVENDNPSLKQTSDEASSDTKADKAAVATK